MSAGGAGGGPPDDLGFRCAAAPWMDEDDVFTVLLCGAPGEALWGAGRPWPSLEPDRPWSEERERRARHERLLRAWRVVGDQAPPPPAA